MGLRAAPAAKGLRAASSSLPNLSSPCSPAHPRSPAAAASGPKQAASGASEACVPGSSCAAPCWCRPPRALPPSEPACGSPARPPRPGQSIGEPKGVTAVLKQVPRAAHLVEEAAQARALPGLPCDHSAARSGVPASAFALSTSLQVCCAPSPQRIATSARVRTRGPRLRLRGLGRLGPHAGGGARRHSQVPVVERGRARRPRLRAHQAHAHYLPAAAHLRRAPARLTPCHAAKRAAALVRPHLHSGCTPCHMFPSLLSTAAAVATGLARRAAARPSVCPERTGVWRARAPGRAGRRRRGRPGAGAGPGGAGRPAAAAGSPAPSPAAAAAAPPGPASPTPAPAPRPQGQPGSSFGHLLQAASARQPETRQRRMQPQGAEACSKQASGAVACAAPRCCRWRRGRPGRGPRACGRARQSPARPPGTPSSACSGPQRARPLLGTLAGGCG